MNFIKWLLLGVVVIVVVLASTTSTTHGSSIELVSNSPNPPSRPNLGESLRDIAVDTTNLVTSVGVFFAGVGEQSPMCLGTLMCLLMPLALMGLWAMSNLRELLGTLGFKSNVRSMLHD